MWSGVRIPKAETESRSRRCPYTTPHEVITSYRIPDRMFCFYIPLFLWVIAKLAHLFTLSVFEMTIFQHQRMCCDYCDVTLLHCSRNKSMHVATMDGGRGDGKGWDSWTPALIKFIINTIQHSLGYWPTIGLYFIRYIKITTFIWCAVCGEIVPHTGDPQQINIPVYLLKSRQYTY